MAQKIYIGKTEVANLDKVYTKSEINTQLSTKASTQQLANALAAVEHEISDVSSDKQNKLTAGSNITISNDVISSIDTTYSAGTGLSIDANNEISVDTNTIATQLDIATVEEEINALELNKQDELVAGTGITIDGNVISSEGTTYTAGSNISIDNDIISAVDTTYEAGTGLDLTGGAFSIDTTVVATKTDLEDKQNVATLDNDVAALGFSKTHGTLTGITMNGSPIQVSSGIADLGTVITDVSDKQDTATLETDVATLGFTKNEGTLTGITMNGSSVSVSSGVADLGTVITDISGKQDTLTAGNNISINSNVVSIDSSNATDGQVLTADGLGGATWENISSGTTDYDELNNIPIINQSISTTLEAFVADETVLTNSSIIHFDTSAEGTTALETMMADATASSSVSSIFSTTNGTSIAIYIIKSSSKYGLVIVNNSSSQFVPIYATAAFSYSGIITFKGGWEDVVDSSTGNCTLDLIVEPTTVHSITDTDNWNGNIFGLGVEVADPVPVQGNYYRKNGGDIYYYDGTNYKKLAIGEFLSAQDPVAYGSFSIERNTLGGIGNRSIAVGNGCIAIGENSSAFGNQTKAVGKNSHAEGSGDYLSGIIVSGEARGYTVTTSSSVSSIEPGQFISYNDGSTVRASRITSVNSSTSPYTISLDTWIFAENKTNVTTYIYKDGALGDYSHSEGYDTTAPGESSHSEGSNTKASGRYSHAEGHDTKASTDYTHAEGRSTVASGQAAHSEGSNTTASGEYSHAEGFGSIALRRCQHVFGRNNIEDPGSTGTDYYNHGKYVEIVGNGDELNVGASRSNARTLDWDGNEWLAGEISAKGFKLPNGTENQFLMADGSVTTDFAYSSLVDTPIADSKNIYSYNNEFALNDVFKDKFILHFIDINDPESFSTFIDQISLYGKPQRKINLLTLYSEQTNQYHSLVLQEVEHNYSYHKFLYFDTLDTVLFYPDTWYAENGNFTYKGNTFYNVDENGNFIINLDSEYKIIEINDNFDGSIIWNNVHMSKQSTVSTAIDGYYFDNSSTILSPIDLVEGQYVNNLYFNPDTLFNISNYSYKLDFESPTHPGAEANSVSLVDIKETKESVNSSSALYIKQYDDSDYAVVNDTYSRIIQVARFDNTAQIPYTAFSNLTYETKKFGSQTGQYCPLAKYTKLRNTSSSYEYEMFVWYYGGYYNIYIGRYYSGSSISSLSDATLMYKVYDYSSTGTWSNNSYTLCSYADITSAYLETLLVPTFFETNRIRIYAKDQWSSNPRYKLVLGGEAVLDMMYSGNGIQLEPGVITWYPEETNTYTTPPSYAGLRYQTVNIDNISNTIDWSTLKTIDPKEFEEVVFNSTKYVSYVDTVAGDEYPLNYYANWLPTTRYTTASDIFKSKNSEKCTLILDDDFNYNNLPNRPIINKAIGSVEKPGNYYLTGKNMYYCEVAPQIAGINPIEVGHIFEAGDKLHFNTALTAAELKNIFELVPYTRNVHVSHGDLLDIATLFTTNDQHIVLEVINTNSASSSSDKQGYLLAIRQSAPDSDYKANRVIIYAEQAGQFRANSSSPMWTWTAGWQNLDTNDDFEVLTSLYPGSTSEVTVVTETTPPCWNSILAGIERSAQPGVFDKVLLETDIKYRHDVFINATVQSTDIAVGFSVYTATEDYNNDFDTLITDLVNTYDNISTNTTDDILANGLYDTSNTPKQVKCVFASTNTPDPSLQVKTWDGSQTGIIVSNITDCYITTVKII